MTTPPRIQHVESWWAAGTLGAAFLILLLSAFTDWTGTKARAAEVRQLTIADSTGVVLLRTTVRGRVETRSITKAHGLFGGGKIVISWWEWTDAEGNVYQQSYGREGPFMHIRGEPQHD